MGLPFAGGQVALEVINDGPTLIGANVSFSIALHFPESQKVLPDGQIVWANDSVVNGEYLSTQALVLKAQTACCPQWARNVIYFEHISYM